MTVIAYRNGVLAADTRVTNGCATRYFARKVTAIEDRYGKVTALIAAAGNDLEAAAFFRWAERAAKSGKLSDQDNPPRIGHHVNDGPSMTGYVIRTGSRDAVEIHTVDGVITYDLGTGGYYAAGAGAEVALGALFAGADAEQAVRAAIAHCGMYCGGYVDVVTFG